MPPDHQPHPLPAVSDPRPSSSGANNSSGQEFLAEELPEQQSLAGALSAEQPVGCPSSSSLQEARSIGPDQRPLSNDLNPVVSRPVVSGPVVSGPGVAGRAVSATDDGAGNLQTPDGDLGAGLTGRPAPTALDVAEQLVIVVLYLGLCWRLLIVLVQQPAPAANVMLHVLVLASEGAVVVFCLVRRPARMLSERASDWVIATAASVFPVLVVPRPDVPPLVGYGLCGMLLLAGVLIQLLAKLTLGRSMGCVPANRGVQVQGPYRFVRHPMYLGYLLSHVAFLLAYPVAWNAAAYGLCWGLQLWRLLREEQLLGEDPQYQQYCRKVTWRLVPGLF